MSPIYEILKGLNALVAIVAVAYLDTVAAKTGEDGQLHLLRLLVIAGLGGFYLADLYRSITKP